MRAAYTLLYSNQRNLQITISSIILKNIYSWIWICHPDAGKEGGDEKWFLAALCVCFHFPDGWSSLLPDLVCVVLHSPVICVSSRTALCAESIYTYHTCLRWVCHIWVFYVLSPLLLAAIGLEGPTAGLCATLHMPNKCACDAFTCAFIRSF